MPSKGKKDIVNRMAPVLVFVSVALAFAVGVLWQKVSNLEGGSVAGEKAQVAPDTAGAGNTPPSRPTQGKLSEDQASKVPQVTDDDHLRGNRDAQVVLIEYSDYECPFCTRFHATAQQVVDEYAGKVAWVYRHFPLDQLHPDARPAAEASECVAELGGEEAFWAFSDKLFEDQTQVGNFVEVAASLGIDRGALQSCIDSGKYQSKVDGVYQAGLNAGITGTPGNFVINSKGEVWLVPGALPFEQIKTTIDEALAS